MYFQETRKLLRTLVDVPIQVVRANVDDVDTDAWTAEVTALDGSGTRYDVQLRVKGDGESLGMITVPKKDSMVLIGIIDNNPDSCYIVQCSEIVKVHIEMGDDLLIEIPEDGKVKIKAKEVLFDESNNGLVDREGLVQRLNILEDDINTFKTTLNGVLQAAVSTAAPAAPDAFHAVMKGALLSYTSQQLTDTVDNDIKTDTITWP